jgi:Abortive infection alpha
MPDEPVNLAAQVLSSIARDVYKDVAHPSARRVGLALETLTKVALSPVSLIDLGFEQSREWLKAKIAERQAQTPPNCVVQPTTNIAYSALSHIALSHDTPELRDLYAELLLKSMDSRTSTSVHPSYFHIVEQLVPQEALVIIALHELGREELFQEDFSPYGSSFTTPSSPPIEKQFGALCASVLACAPTQSDVWLTNLCRLGLLSLQTFGEVVYNEGGYNHHGEYPPSLDNREHRYLMFTDFGRAFISACAPVPAAIAASSSDYTNESP